MTHSGATGVFEVIKGHFQVILSFVADHWANCNNTFDILQKYQNLRSKGNRNGPKKVKRKVCRFLKNITTSVCSTLSPPLPCPAECTIHSFSRKYSDSPNSSLDIALTSDPAAYATLHSWPAVEVVGAAHHHCGSRRLARLRRATTAILISELKR